MKLMLLFLAILVLGLSGYAQLSAYQAKSSIELDDWRRSAKTYSFNKHKTSYKISYHDSFAAGKPVIVLLHGYPTSSWDWRFVWQALEKDFRLISLDMLGFGFSDKPDDVVFSIAEQTDIYQGLLDSLSIKEAHFVAHDYGDIVAQELLARQTETTGVAMRSLVMLNGAIFPEAHEALFVQTLLNSPVGAVLSQFNSRAIFGVSLNKVFGSLTKLNKRQLDDYWFLAVRENGHRLNHKLLHYIDDRHTFRARWVGATLNTSVPIILINGVADPVAGENMVQRYIELVPKPKVVRLAGVGHFPHIEAPKELVSELRAFLEAL